MLWPVFGLQTKGAQKKSAKNNNKRITKLLQQPLQLIRESNND